MVERVADPVRGSGDVEVLLEGDLHLGRFVHSVEEDEEVSSVGKRHAPGLLPPFRVLLAEDQPSLQFQGVLVQGEQLRVQEDFQLVLGEGFQLCGDSDGRFQAYPGTVLRYELG